MVESGKPQICGCHQPGHQESSPIDECVWSGTGCHFIIHRLVPTSFLPTEDQGYFKIELELPEGATLERTRVVTDRAVQYLEKNPYVAYVQNVTGSSPAWEVTRRAVN